METTAATPDALTAELVALEQRLLQPAVRHDADHLCQLLLPEFMEFGSSGRVFDRAAIVQSLLSEEPTEAPALSDAACFVLGPDAALLTYRLFSARGQSLRSSLWVRRDEQWRMLFHQGTRVPPDARPAP